MPRKRKTAALEVVPTRKGKTAALESITTVKNPPAAPTDAQIERPQVIPPHLWDLPDLTFGAYPQYPPITGRDARLDDVLVFLVENGVASIAFVEMSYTGPNHSAPAPYDIRIGAPFPVVRNQHGLLRPDVVDVRFTPQDVIDDVNSTWGLRLPQYPGYDARHSKVISPVGEPWPQHPWNRPGYEMYRPSPADNDQDYPVFVRDHLGQGMENVMIIRELRNGRQREFRRHLTAVGIAWQDVTLFGN